MTSFSRRFHRMAEWGQGRLCLHGIGVFFLGVALLVVGVPDTLNFVRQWRFANVSEATQGVVVLSQVDEQKIQRRRGGQRLVYRPDIRYRYAVENGSFENDLLYFGYEGNTIGFDDAAVWVDSRPPGASVEVWFDPDHPQQSMLRSGLLGSHLQNLMEFIGLLLIWFYCLVAILHQLAAELIIRPKQLRKQNPARKRALPRYRLPLGLPVIVPIGMWPVWLGLFEELNRGDTELSIEQVLMWFKLWPLWVLLCIAVVIPWQTALRRSSP